MRKNHRPILSLLLGAALIAGGAGSAAAQGLPGGATALNETHGDWTLACLAPEGAVRCAISQTQVRGESGQRVLAVELAATDDNRAASGALILPFGLALDDGVRLAIDDAAPMPALRFSTCLPAGCLVPLSLDQAMLAALRAGTTLQVKSNASDSGQEITFTISLAGFAAAFDRAQAIGQR